MNIERNSERILIKYVDSNLTTYKCKITENDVFVLNFCKKNLEKMEKILQNYVLEEMDDHYLLKVDDPVCLQYILKKQDDIPNISDYIDRIRLLEGRIVALEKNLLGRINHLEKEVVNLQGRKIEQKKSKPKSFFHFPGCVPHDVIKPKEKKKEPKESMTEIPAWTLFQD